jgi:ABC-type hemin transport system substrate-binding protein
MSYWTALKARLDMSESAKPTWNNDPLLKCIWVLREQADQAIEAGDYEAAGTMLENAGSLCWILQKRVTA